MSNHNRHNAPTNAIRAAKIGPVSRRSPVDPPRNVNSGFGGRSGAVTVARTTLVVFDGTIGLPVPKTGSLVFRVLLVARPGMVEFEHMPRRYCKAAKVSLASPHSPTYCFADLRYLHAPNSPVSHSSRPRICTQTSGR
jgi:hypothetical protein